MYITYNQSAYANGQQVVWFPEPEVYSDRPMIPSDNFIVIWPYS